MLSQFVPLADPAKGLRHANAAQRVRAVKALASAGEAVQNAIPTLKMLLDDPDETVREAAAAAAGRLGPAALSVLTAALRHPDRHVRRQAVWGLRRLGPAAAAVVLELGQTLDDADPRTATGAAQALAGLGAAAAPALSDLARALRGPNPVLCRLSARALTAIGRPALPALTEALADPDSFVRREAALAIGWLGPRAAAAIPALMALIQPPSDGGEPTGLPRPPRPMSSGHRTPIAPDSAHGPAAQRLYAIQALGRIGLAARPAVPLLLAALSDPVADVRDAAREALALIRRPDRLD